MLGNCCEVELLRCEKIISGIFEDRPILVSDRQTFEEVRDRNSWGWFIQNNSQESDWISFREFNQGALQDRYDQVRGISLAVRN